jgi:hypothetical protein
MLNNGLRAFPLIAWKPGATRQGCAVDSWILKYLVVMSWFATHFNVFQAGDIISTVHFGDQGCQICCFLKKKSTGRFCDKKCVVLGYG